jgi:hypothetical protein
MPSPKPGAPSQYWVQVTDELVNCIDDPGSPTEKAFISLAFPFDMEYIPDVAAFCAAGQPSYDNDVTESDLIDGSYRDKIKAIARANAFYNLCEE